MWILRELEALVDKYTAIAITDLLKKFTHLYQYFSKIKKKRKLETAQNYFTSKFENKRY